MSALIALAFLASCGLLVSFDDFDTGGASSSGGGTDARFVVGGVVDGLGSDPKATVSLSLNAGPALPAHDGHFAFPEKLADGAGFGVTVIDSPGFSCSLTPTAKGAIAGHDVDDVAVHCISAEVLLSSLTISTGPLTPAFVPSTTTYSAGPTHVPVVPGATVSAVLAATSSRPDALITLPGATPAKGTATTSVTVGLGPNPFAIGVTAPDGQAKGTYSLAVTGEGSSAYLKSPTPNTLDVFGAALALDGDTLAVGALGENANAGAVYVLKRTNGGWTQQARLVAPAAPVAAQFGSAVALAGDTLVVGARSESTFGGGAGAAYVFTRTGATWSLPVTLKAVAPKGDAAFGWAVAISGDTIAVAAPGESFTASNGVTYPSTGAIHLFTRDGASWTQPTVVRAMNATATQRLGDALALDGDLMAVGEPSRDSGAGRAYVFRRPPGGSWSEGRLGQIGVLGLNTAFGHAVAVAGDTIVVGAPGESSGGITDSGAIYVFTYSSSDQTWTQSAFLKAPTPRVGARLGSSVALLGDVIASGAEEESSDAKGVNGDELNTKSAESGAAFLFQRTGPKSWAKRVYLKASNTRGAMAFGRAVALGKDTVAVGAPAEASGAAKDPTDTSQLAAGAVYAF